MSVDADTFRAAMARFPGAVTIITALAGRERRGLTATAVCSVSAEPPSLLICVNRKTGTNAAIASSGFFTVNLLSNPDAPLALRFAGAGGVMGEEKFAEGDWQPSPRGLPLLASAAVSFCCEVSSMMQSGSHSVFIGRIEDIHIREGTALLYEQSKFHRLSPI